MTVRTEYRSRNDRPVPRERPIHCLVIGQEGVLALGGLLGGLLHLKGLNVDESVSFDHARKLSVYEIKTKAVETSGRDTEADLIICLNDESLDYETRIKKRGILLLNANCVTRRPRRTDLDIVSVPAFSLVQDISTKMTEETKDRFDPTLSSLLGGFEAVESEYPDPEILKRVFDNLQIAPADPFLSAVYRGYDWLQEARMRGKTPWGGALN